MIREEENKLHSVSVVSRNKKKVIQKFTRGANASIYTSANRIRERDRYLEVPSDEEQQIGKCTRARRRE